MLGFTRTEERFFLFLIGSFLIGSGIRFYQNRFAALPETARSFPMRAEIDSVEAVVPEETKASRPQNKGALVSINQAGWEELSGLPGIGPVLARRIVDYRVQKGPFLRIDDLLKVQGIGSKKFEMVRAYITLHRPGEVPDSNEKF